MATRPTHTRHTHSDSSVRFCRTVLWESTRTFVASGESCVTTLLRSTIPLLTRTHTHGATQYAARGTRHAGNKLLVPGGFTEYNYYRARKEIVHSFRYLLFAIQLVKTGRIDDYAAANHHLADILREKQENEEKQKRHSDQLAAGAGDGDEAELELVDRPDVAAGKRWRGARRNDENTEEAKRWAAVMARFKPLFEQLRQELKDLRDFARLYSRCETEKMLFTSLKDRRRDMTTSVTTATATATTGDEGEQTSETARVDESPLATIRFLQHFKGLAPDNEYSRVPCAVCREPCCCVELNTATWFIHHARPARTGHRSTRGGPPRGVL